MNTNEHLLNKTINTNNLLQRFGKKNIFLFIWGVFVLYIIYGTLFPFHFSCSLENFFHNLENANLRPFSYGIGFLDGRADTIANVLFFFPYGFFLYLIQRHKSIRLIILSALCFSLIIEFIQLFSVSRSSSANDVFCNTLGAGIGVVVARYIYHHFNARIEESLEFIFAQPLLIYLILYSLFICLLKLFPYDIAIDTVNINKNVKDMIDIIPSKFNVNSIIMNHKSNFFLFIPFSFFLFFYLKRHTSLNATLNTLILGSIFSLLVEFCRLFILGITVIILGIVDSIVGVLIGNWIAFLFWRYILNSRSKNGRIS